MKRLIMAVTTAGTLFGASPVLSADLWRPVPVRAEHARPPEVRFWNNAWKTQQQFFAFEKQVQTGGHVAVGDVDGDRTADIIIGAGQGSEPLVKIFSLDGTLKRSFAPYAKGFRGGVRVAVGDTDGDGTSEIMTAPGPGMEAKIHIFTAEGTHKLASGILAYAKNFLGGVHIAAGDLDRDGKTEIITSPGPGGGPHVRIFNGMMENIGKDFFPFDSHRTDGVAVSIIRSPAGPSIVVAVESWEAPVVKTFVRDAASGNMKLATSFLAFDATSRNGVTTSGWDYDNDGNDEIVAVRSGGEWPEVRVFDRYGTKMASALLMDPGYRGTLSLAQVYNMNGQAMLVSMPNAPVVNGPTTAEKLIRVNLKEQRLYAYQRGRTARTFLISSGTAKFPTPTMTTSVLKKIPIMDYRWSYGPNHPDNYNLKNVRFNLNIWPHYYIHNAYWHRNFGHRMSHGCINTNLQDAEWIYNWADVGTTVIVQ